MESMPVSQTQTGEEEEEKVKVYIYYEDTDNSCSDPDCCGGPCPSPAIKVFSTMENALKHHKTNEIKAIELDDNELVHILC